MTIKAPFVNVGPCSYSISLCVCVAFLCTITCGSVTVFLLVILPVSPLLLLYVFVRLPETEGFHSTLHGCARKPSRGCEVSSRQWSQSEHSNWGIKELWKVWSKCNHPICATSCSLIQKRCVSILFCSLSVFIAAISSPWLNLSSNLLLFALGWIHASRRGSSAGTWKRCSPAHQLWHQGKSPPPCIAHSSTQRRYTHSGSVTAKRPKSWCTQQGWSVLLKIKTFFSWPDHLEFLEFLESRLTEIHQHSWIWIQIFFFYLLTKRTNAYLALTQYFEPELLLCDFFLLWTMLIYV